MHGGCSIFTKKQLLHIRDEGKKKPQCAYHTSWCSNKSLERKLIRLDISSPVLCVDKENCKTWLSCRLVGQQQNIQTVDYFCNPVLVFRNGGSGSCYWSWFFSFLFFFWSVKSWNGPFGWSSCWSLHLILVWEVLKCAWLECVCVCLCVPAISPCLESPMKTMVEEAPSGCPAARQATAMSWPNSALGQPAGWKRCSSGS